MLNLYCYHSPVSSSVGFQEAGWTIADGGCSVMNAAYASKEVRKLLRSGGFEAICIDTGRNTRAFIVRGITVRQGVQSGWKLNFALETDMESDSLWKDLTAAFLNDCDGFTGKFAALFSIRYENGEHYVIDKEGLLRLIHESAGSMDVLQKRSEKDETSSDGEMIHTFVQKLYESYENGKVRILLLVPAVTLDYFMRYAPLINLPVPEGCCMEKEVWEAFLEHRELPGGFAKAQPTESCITAKHGFFMHSLAIFGGSLAAAVLAVFGFWRMLKKRRQVRRR